jgi:hypothetical protein
VVLLEDSWLLRISRLLPSGRSSSLLAAAAPACVSTTPRPVLACPAAAPTAPPPLLSLNMWSSAAALSMTIMSSDSLARLLPTKGRPWLRARGAPGGLGGSAELLKPPALLAPPYAPE